MIFSDFLIGTIEDNAGLFSLPQLITGLSGCSEQLGYPAGVCQNLFADNQPFTYIPIYVLIKVLHPVIAFNISVTVIALLNYFMAVCFFRRLFSKFIARSLSVILLFSPYLSYQARSHLDLAQVWVVILFLNALLFYHKKYRGPVLGLLATLMLGVSNYLAYFTLLLTAIYLGGLAVYKMVGKSSHPDILFPIKQTVLAVIVFTLTSFWFIVPYVKANFFTPRVRPETNKDTKSVNRPIEDFITFSARPWYFFLPSVDNPFFGQATKTTLAKLSSTGNYLTQNYFKPEHPALYLGLVNIALGVAGLAGISKKKTSQQLAKHKLVALAAANLVLMILTLPPVVELWGMKLHMPSYLLFLVFPMFRVLARAGALILFLNLIFVGYGYEKLQDWLASKNIAPSYAKASILLLVLISLAEFFIPLKLAYVGKAPQVYNYIASLPASTPIVVYPYSKTTEALFWLQYYKKPLINPRYYANKETDFNSEAFTKTLNTSEGLEKAQALGAVYLVYFPNADSAEALDFYTTSNLLRVQKDFRPAEALNFSLPWYDPFVKVIDTSDPWENSALLYKFR
ncbi:MAG: hypothetical protein UW82_C0022G0008 [candidate division WWE3 bacterium GW2011_GWC2_44_9]|uniref:Glycosyltransferase RgtA/B/C/D-like domain-containing protein n=1 Tax=candidate division WWE3 bacterium GW2011_GWC2_44_9 TaxID=1619125 RepID=A0A0G1KL05_UNCKA|nr:MAG: hypothetical protein UW82_C0022G0008 [candidate division WWE3 bacterium GW2011_GWC2_44_9]